MTDLNLPIIVDIDRYVLVISYNAMTLYSSGLIVAQVEPEYGDPIGLFCQDAMKAGNLRVGFADYGDFEVIMPYDQQEGFGYAWNIPYLQDSEWGSPDFPTGGESLIEFDDRVKTWIGDMTASMGDAFIIGSPPAIRRSVASPR